MELYLIRHGTTDWNKEAKFQGSVDIELNREGRELAGKLGERLENISFDTIFSSPLIRAYETACLIRGHKNIQIVRDERLREISFGGLEGIPYTQWIDTDHPRKYFFTAPDKYLPPEGGETFESVCQRTKDFIQNEIEPLQKTNPDGRYMIVAHGALLAGMMCYMENYGVDQFWGHGLKGNCEETIFKFENSKWIKMAEQEKAIENPYEAKAK